jgi:hypothetical protein
MEFLVPLMPLFGSLPIALGAVVIVFGILRHRERLAGKNEEIDRLRDEIDALRAGQTEMQERLDFAERLLATLRDPRRARE